MLKIVADTYNVQLCNKISEDPIKIVLINQLKTIFYFTSYSTWKAVFGKYLNIISTFIWSFMDLFVMLISVGLASRFRQINDHLFRHKGQVSNILSTKIPTLIMIIISINRKCLKIIGLKIV